MSKLKRLSILDKLPQKYKTTEEDKEELKVIGKRVLKLIIIVTLIKVLRLYMYNTGSNGSNFIAELFSVITVEEFFKFTAILSLMFGVIFSVTTYIIIGTKVLRKRLYIYLFFFFIIDSIFIYLHPEIPSSVFRAVFIYTE